MVGIEQVSAPDGRVVHTANTNEGEQFEFFAHRRGRYKFCFHNPSSAPEQITFYIHVGHIPGISDLARDGEYHSNFRSNTWLLHVKA